MNKILNLIASLFVEKMMNNAKPASAMMAELVLAQGRTIAMGLVAGLTFSFVLAGGLLLSVIAGVNWFDGTSSNPYLFYAGLSITILSTFFLSVIFTKKHWTLSEEAKRTLSPKADVVQAKSPVEDMIHLFISEYAKESAKPADRSNANTPPLPLASPIPPVSE